MKLLLEYLHSAGYVHWEVNKWLSIGLIVLIFGVAYWQARKKGPVPDDETMADEAEQLLKE